MEVTKDQRCKQRRHDERALRFPENVEQVEQHREHGGDEAAARVEVQRL